MTVIKRRYIEMPKPGAHTAQFIQEIDPDVQLIDDLSISIDDNKIARVDSTKFLGVIINQNLSWQPHITTISSKIAKSIGIIIKDHQITTVIVLSS